MKLKYIPTLLLFVLIYSCGSNNLEISSSFKRIKYPGLPTEKSIIQYTIAFENKKDFIVDNLKLNSEKISNFLLFSIPLDRYVKSEDLHAKGSYVLTFKIADMKQIDTEDFVLLFLNIDDKIQKHKIPIVLKKASRAK